MAIAPVQNPAPPARLLRALRGEALPVPPLWLMRQAGRYLPEYRALRDKAGSFLGLCYTPQYAAEATLQPVRRFKVDAAILFSDILVLPHALGQELSFAQGEGPRLAPLSSRAGFERLDYAGFGEKLAPVYETARRVRAALDPATALIGFAGAPWTVACYMAEGRGDGAFEKALCFMREEPEAFGRFIDLLADATARHLILQIDAGADAVQLFDSWAGLLPGEADFMRWAAAPARRIVEQVRKARPGVPVIGFPRGAGGLYPAYARETGVQGLGLDMQAPLEKVLEECPPGLCLQGNLDPALLRAGGEEMEAGARRLLRLMRGRPFIFNLGHGVIKDTPPGHVARLADIVGAFEG